MPEKKPRARKEPVITILRLRRNWNLKFVYTIESWAKIGIGVIYEMNGKTRQALFKTIGYPDWWKINDQYEVNLRDYSCDCPGGCMKISKRKSKSGKEQRDCYHSLLSRKLKSMGVFDASTDIHDFDNQPE